MITIKSLQQTFYFLEIEGQLISLKPNEQIIIDETKLNARQLKEIINLTVEDKIELLDYSLNQLKDKLEELSPLSTTSLKTINGESIVGSGDIVVEAGSDSSEQYLDDLGSSVHISGGNLIPTGGVNFSVEAGTGYARAEDGTLKRITWGNTTSSTVYPGDNYIVVNSNSEIINLSANSVSSNGLYVPLGYIFTNATNTTILGLSNIRLTGKDNLYRISELFRTTLGSLVESGCSTAMQASPNQLQVTTSAGKIWNSLNRYDVAETSSFNKIFKHNSGFDFDILTTPNTINNTHYNVSSNPINSCIVEMTTGFYKKDIIGLTPTGVAYYLYGTSEHLTLEEAKIAPLPQVPENIKNSIVRSCAIIIQKGAPEVAELLDIRPIFQRIFEVGAAASNATVISHNDLVDLATDSHLQYLNEIRGDIRYYRKAEVDTALESKAAEDHLHSIVTNTENGFMSSSDKTKLDTIEANATVNETDDFLRDRANHTGTQDISTINNLSTTLTSKQDSLVSGTNLKTINGESLLGAGNIVASGGSVIEYNTPTSPYRRIFDDFMVASATLNDITKYNLTTSGASLITQQSGNNPNAGSTGVLTVNLTTAASAFSHVYGLNRTLILPNMLVGEYNYYESAIKPRYFFNTTPNTLMAVGFFGGTGNLSAIPDGFYVAYQATTETFVGFIKNNGVVSTFNFLETIPAFNVQQYKKFSVRIERLTLTDYLSGRGIFEITFGVDSIFRKTTLEYDKRSIFFGPGTLFTRENQGQSTGNTVNLQIDYADHIIYRPDRS